MTVLVGGVDTHGVLTLVDSLNPCAKLRGPGLEVLVADLLALQRGLEGHQLGIGRAVNGGTARQGIVRVVVHIDLNARILGSVAGAGREEAVVAEVVVVQRLVGHDVDLLQVRALGKRLAGQLLEHTAVQEVLLGGIVLVVEERNNLQVLVVAEHTFAELLDRTGNLNGREGGVVHVGQGIGPDLTQPCRQLNGLQGGVNGVHDILLAEAVLGLLAAVAGLEQVVQHGDAGPGNVEHPDGVVLEQAGRQGLHARARLGIGSVVERYGSQLVVLAEDVGGQRLQPRVRQVHARQVLHAGEGIVADLAADPVLMAQLLLGTQVDGRCGSSIECAVADPQQLRALGGEGDGSQGVVAAEGIVLDGVNLCGECDGLQGNAVLERAFQYLVALQGIDTVQTGSGRGQLNGGQRLVHGALVLVAALVGVLLLTEPDAVGNGLHPFFRQVAAGQQHRLQRGVQEGIRSDGGISQAVAVVGLPVLITVNSIGAVQVQLLEPGVGKGLLADAADCRGESAREPGVHAVVEGVVADAPGNRIVEGTEQQGLVLLCLVQHGYGGGLLLRNLVGINTGKLVNTCLGSVLLRLGGGQLRLGSSLPSQSSVQGFRSLINSHDTLLGLGNVAGGIAGVDVKLGSRLRGVNLELLALGINFHNSVALRAVIFFIIRNHSTVLIILVHYIVEVSVNIFHLDELGISQRNVSGDDNFTKHPVVCRCHARHQFSKGCGNGSKHELAGLCSISSGEVHAYA